MAGIIKNITRVERDGIKFFTSGAIFTPTTSQSSIPQIVAISCSADVGNNIATTSSLSGYFIIPLASGSTGTLESNLNIFYVTASIFDFEDDVDTGATASGTPTYFTPETSNTVTNFNIPVRIERNETANNIAIKTCHAMYSASVLIPFVTSSISASHIVFTNTISGALTTPFISASGFSFNYVQSGSFGSGSFANYRPAVGSLEDISSSFSIIRDTNDVNSVEFSKLTQNNQTPVFYMSGSGRLGFNTRDPKTGLDAVVDEVQFQRPGTRKGLKINKEGNIESFDSDPATASTGSEFVLRFSRGTAVTKVSLAALDITVSDDTAATAFFDALKDADKNAILEKLESVGFIDPAQTGDTLGAIRWVSDSGSIDGLNDRTTGETAVIKAVVSDADITGIQADLIFSVAGKTGAAVQKLLLDATNDHQLTGSLEISSNLTANALTLTNGDIDLGGGSIEGSSATSDINNIRSLTGFGSLTFGNTSADKHRFVGNITASGAGTGNISASGTITALSSNIVTINGGSF
mgnify:FL=1|tara:strand:+ start:417 stop:1988 length:1572 start_codon:yes stop_codon:yes gene_type:complete